MKEQLSVLLSFCVRLKCVTFATGSYGWIPIDGYLVDWQVPVVGRGRDGVTSPGHLFQAKVSVFPVLTSLDSSAAHPGLGWCGGCCEAEVFSQQGYGFDDQHLENGKSSPCWQLFD